MVPTWATASACVLLTFASLASAGDEPPAPTPAPTAQPLLPPVPQLRLRWPLGPQQFSFSASEVPGFGSRPLQLFQAEALWLSAGNLRVLTTGRVELATELECALLCQPVLAHTLSIDARFALPKLTNAVPSSYGFVRAGQQTTRSGGRSATLLKTGIAGTLNF